MGFSLSSACATEIWGLWAAKLTCRSSHSPVYHEIKLIKATSWHLSTNISVDTKPPTPSAATNAKCYEMYFKADSWIIFKTQRLLHLGKSYKELLFHNLNLGWIYLRFWSSEVKSRSFCWNEGLIVLLLEDASLVCGRMWLVNQPTLSKSAPCARKTRC